MTDETLQNMAVAIGKELEIQVPERVTEEELLQLLAERIAMVVQQGQEAFYRLMYRLDISEKKLNAMAGTSDVAAKVARLIYERQLAKAEARRQHRQGADDTDPDLKW